MTAGMKASSRILSLSAAGDSRKPLVVSFEATWVADEVRFYSFAIRSGENRVRRFAARFSTFRKICAPFVRDFPSRHLRHGFRDDEVNAARRSEELRSFFDRHLNQPASTRTWLLKVLGELPPVVGMADDSSDEEVERLKVDFDSEHKDSMVAVSGNDNSWGRHVVSSSCVSLNAPVAFAYVAVCLLLLFLSPLGPS
jgi:hypothetical protein